MDPPVTLEVWHLNFSQSDEVVHIFIYMEEEYHHIMECVAFSSLVRETNEVCSKLQIHFPQID